MSPPPSSVFEINKPPPPAGGLIEDFNKQNCLPVNELNINGVKKKDLRF